MSVYTISPNLLRSIQKEEAIYFTDILFVFTRRNNSYKVTKDKKGTVINSYANITENGDIIKTWLDFMSFMPSPFETIDIDISNISCEETRFLKICKETRGSNNFILYSKQYIEKHKIEGSFVQFEETAIRVLDRDEARDELNPALNSGDTYINSQVARNNSTISDSENK